MLLLCDINSKFWVNCFIFGKHLFFCSLAVYIICWILNRRQFKSLFWYYMYSHWKATQDFERGNFILRQVAEKVKSKYPQKGCCHCNHRLVYSSIFLMKQYPFISFPVHFVLFIYLFVCLFTRISLWVKRKKGKLVQSQLPLRLTIWLWFFPQLPQQSCLFQRPGLFSFWLYLGRNNAVHIRKGSI